MKHLSLSELANWMSLFRRDNSKAEITKINLGLQYKGESGVGKVLPKKT